MGIETSSSIPGDCIGQHVLEAADISSFTLVGDEEEENLDNAFEPLTAGSAYPRNGFFALDATPLHTDNLDMACIWHTFSMDLYRDHKMLDLVIDDEEDVNQALFLSTSRSTAYPSPSPTVTSSPTISTLTLAINEPMFNPFSTEMLITRFALVTCGILSIKDGHNENPWRTMLLPMSFGVPALHHAILCLSAFHASRADKRFRITGLQQMQKSIRYLSNQLSTMRRDAALATTLVLAFSESWNEETSTGIRHLKGARALVTQAIANHKVEADFDEMERLKFLRNTWVYIDVIARITALDDDDLENLDALFAPVYGPDSQVGELDPLMGCAGELFPLLGKVANLVREIRRSTGSSPRIVSKAAALKVDILKWMPPTDLRVPQDQSIEVAHTLSTAEAYRWSALLFLYQAVPMIATESPCLLAERILFHLVSVPLTSRVIIIQIFPLLVAGCELTHRDNRLLVKERWASMTQRMAIGNLDRCSDVVDEVWTRRDEISRLTEDQNQTLMHGEEADELSSTAECGNGLNRSLPCPNAGRPDQVYRLPSDAVTNIANYVTVQGHGPLADCDGRLGMGWYASLSTHVYSILMLSSLAWLKHEFTLRMPSTGSCCDLAGVELDGCFSCSTFLLRAPRLKGIARCMYMPAGYLGFDTNGRSVEFGAHPCVRCITIRFKGHQVEERSVLRVQHSSQCLRCGHNLHCLM